MANKQNLFWSDCFTAESVKYYSKHILDYTEDVIFHKDSKNKYGGELFLSSQQEDILLAIQDNKKVTARSGRGIGKTSALSIASKWFLDIFPDDTKVIMTSPSFSTLKTALWPELYKWHSRSLTSELYEYSDRKMYLKESKEKCFCEPRTAKSKESFSGIHAKHLLIIVDEASGMEDDILYTLDATLTSGTYNRIVLLSNPTKIVGMFYDTHCKPYYEKTWKRLKFSSKNSPFTDKDQIEQKIAQFGPNHTMTKVDIEGEFPDSNSDSYLTLAEVQDAINREIEPAGDIFIGVDPARFGDDSTVLFWRQGYKVYPAKTLAKSSGPEVVELVINTVKEIRMKTGYQKKIKVMIDVGGLGGPIADFLKLDRENNIEVIMCNFGGAGNDRFQNEASVMWGNIKDQIGLMDLPNDELLREELAARRMSFPNGKVMIEPKAEFKKEFGRSPDRADALVLCFAKKSNERVVIKDFDPLDVSLVKQTVNYAGEDKYASVFYSKDMFISVVYGAWDGRRLYVYDTYKTDDSLMMVATNLFSHQPLSRIIGNERMFSTTGTDISMKYRKFNIVIHENLFFNELAAIDTLSSMVTQKRLVVNSNCNDLITQLSDWKMDLSKTELERQYGLCYALCNMVSELRKKMDNRSTNIVIPSYAETNRIISTSDYGEHGWML